MIVSVAATHCGRAAICPLAPGPEGRRIASSVVVRRRRAARAAGNPASKTVSAASWGALPVVPAPGSEPGPGWDPGGKGGERGGPRPGPAARALAGKAGCGQPGGPGGGGVAVPGHYGVGGPKVRAGLLAARAGQPAERVHTPPGSDRARPDIGLTESLRVEVAGDARAHLAPHHRQAGRQARKTVCREARSAEGRIAGLPGPRRLAHMRGAPGWLAGRITRHDLPSSRPG